jgi:hypothetical protein
MRKLQRRLLAVTAAVGSVAALGLLSAPPASAATLPATSSAYGVKACLLAALTPTSCTVPIGPLPSASFPAGPTTAQVANVALPPVGNVGVIDVAASGNNFTGTSTATATTNNTALLLGTVPGVAIAADAVDATVIKATCSATKTTSTGSATFAGLTLGGNAVPLGPLGAATPNFNLLNLPGLGDSTNLLKVVLNEQTKNGNVITVNAVHVYLGPIVNGQGSLGDVIISHVSCGPNAGMNASITGIDPDHGPTSGGTTVTLTGTCFVAGQTTVTIGGITIPASKVTVAADGKSLTFVTPPHAAGPVHVTVSTPCGPAGPVTFTYIAPKSSSASSAPPSALPTGVPAGFGTHEGSPVLLITLLLLGLSFAGGGVVAYRKRGMGHQH